MPHVKTYLKFQTIEEECDMSRPKEEKITSILGLENVSNLYNIDIDSLLVYVLTSLLFENKHVQ